LEPLEGKRAEMENGWILVTIDWEKVRSQRLLDSGIGTEEGMHCLNLLEEII
jgi:hypothetical protein